MSEFLIYPWLLTRSCLSDRPSVYYSVSYLIFPFFFESFNLGMWTVS